MKKLRHYALLTFAAMAVFGCSKDYDDTELRNDVNDLKSRVEKLETWCTTANSQISALQGLVAALEAKDYVTGVSPVTNGYAITFSKSDAITIYNGKDGAKGADGVTPVIGVDKFEGEYYWTVKIGTTAATWMLDTDGKKIRTTGDKGADGSAGINGQSPVLSVATDTDGKVYWKVNGEWLLNGGKKVQATGDKGDKGETGSAGAAGAAGAQGDAVFAADGVTVDKTKGTVTFTLAGKDGETFTLPMASEMKIFDKFDEFKVNSEKHELTLALNVKEGDYAAIKAELTSSKGMMTAVVKATTRAASTPWGVELTNPTFKEDKTIDINAKVTFALPANIEKGEFALLKVTVVGKDGTEHSATRVIVYTTDISVESIALTDKSITEGSTIKLEPTFTPATATNKNVTWKSSKPEVATIAADGTVTSVVAGKTVITVTTEDGGLMSTCEVTVVEKINIVGHYYYSDGTHSAKKEADKTVIGIVFWQDPNDDTKGKIVSLDEGIEKGWGTKPMDESAAGVIGIRSSTDGATGTKNLIMKYKDNSKFSTDYSAFAWIYEKNNNDVNGRWYLPAKDELLLELLPQMTAVNATLNSISAVPLVNIYWSSTEASAYGAFSVGFKQSSAFQNGKTDTGRNVRAISVF